MPRMVRRRREASPKAQASVLRGSAAAGLLLYPIGCFIHLSVGIKLDPLCWVIDPFWV